LVVNALNAVSLRLGLRERWQEQGREDRDDRNHHQEFDERKCRGRTKPRTLSEAESFHNSSTVAGRPLTRKSVFRRLRIEHAQRLGLG